jgi:UDP-N-acetyl-D-mannosaminuronic acid dehydrogenase
VEGVKRRIGSLRGRKVAVLGLAFKAGTDDERDSLSHKLVRILERELADVEIHDPHVSTPTATFDDAVTGADVVFVATNHREFCGPEGLRAIAERVRGDSLLVDPWDCWGVSQVFAYANEVATLASFG